MNVLTASGIVFAAAFGGSLLGMLLRVSLPEHHLVSDSKDIVKLAMGLLATMAALVLGLLIASANSSFDNRRSELQSMAANVVVLDRVMASYGPETNAARNLLRRDVARAIELIWNDGRSQPPQFDPSLALTDAVYDEILGLSPQNDKERSLQAEAVRRTFDLSQMRWLLFEQEGISIPVPFLVVLIVWLSMIFASFGLFAPANSTVIVALLLCALSVASAIFTILELAEPFGGLIQISSTPLRKALAHLGQ